MDSSQSMSIMVMTIKNRKELAFKSEVAYGPETHRRRIRIQHGYNLFWLHANSTALNGLGELMIKAAQEGGDTIEVSIPPLVSRSKEDVSE